MACRQVRSMPQYDNSERREETWTSCDIFMIDFGVSRKYIDENGVHLPNEDVLSFIGNIIFASHIAFRCQTLSRRDDIIQIIYNLVYLMNPEDSWVYKILNSGDIQE